MYWWSINSPLVHHICRRGQCLWYNLLLFKNYSSIRIFISSVEYDSVQIQIFTRGFHALALVLSKPMTSSFSPSEHVSSLALFLTVQNTHPPLSRRWMKAKSSSKSMKLTQYPIPPGSSPTLQNSRVTPSKWMLYLDLLSFTSLI